MVADIRRLKPKLRLGAQVKVETKSYPMVHCQCGSKAEVIFFGPLPHYRHAMCQKCYASYYIQQDRTIVFRGYQCQGWACGETVGSGYLVDGTFYCDSCFRKAEEEYDSAVHTSKVGLEHAMKNREEFQKALKASSKGREG